MAQITAPETVAGLCIEADVYYGDTKLPPDRIKLAVGPGTASSEALVRIQTNLPVDEPVVTVYFREGCSQKTTRKYVLLSEVLSEPPTQLPSTFPEIMAGTGASRGTPSLASSVASPSASASTSASTSGSSTSSAGVPAGTSGATGSAGTSQPARARAAARAASPARAASAPVPAVRPARVQPAPSRSRLKLDPIDLGAERDPVLRASPSLLTTPTDDVQRRAEASALWQALNAQPQDILRNNERLKALEADVARALAQSRTTDTSVNQLRSELAQAQSERYNNWVIYGLLGLIPLSLLLAFFLWNERRKRDDDEDDGPWWRRSPGQADDVLPEPAGSTFGGSEPAIKTAALAAAAAAASSGEDSTLPGRSRPAAAVRPVAKVDGGVRDSTSGFNNSRSGFTNSRSGFTNSLSSVDGSGRMVNAEELFDVQQQADFFLSLGNADKAVEVLRHHISENVDTSAMAYLDLFDLYHTLERQDEYETLRTEFNQLFNAQVPAFDEYSTTSQGLEGYPSAMSRIESLWGTPKVLDVIEESIFRKPGSGDDAFSLAAYRELLLLHAIAKRISDRQAAAEPVDIKQGPVSRPGFAQTSIQPLSAEMRDATVMDLTRPPASPRLGLDIDLTEAFDDAPAFILPPSSEFDSLDTHGPDTLPPLPLPEPDVTEHFLSATETPPAPSRASDPGNSNMIEFELDPIEPVDHRDKKK